MSPGRIESGSASAGPAQTMDPSATRARAGEPSLLGSDDLDARQERLREKRRQGGPDLTDQGQARDERAPQDAPDVPETDTAEPPA